MSRHVCYSVIVLSVMHIIIHLYGVDDVVLLTVI